MTRALTFFRVLGGAGLLAAALFGSSLFAQDRDAYGAPADAAPPAPDAARDEYGEVRQTVARIAVVEGTASYARGDDPENWQPANPNVPLTIGDRLYAGSRSRAELQIEGGAYARIGSATDLAVLNLTDDTKQFAVKSGVASFQIRSLDENDVFEIDTPNAAVTVERPGDYRVDVDANGGTLVSVREGAASVAAGGGSVSLGNGDAMRIMGLDSPQYDVVPVSASDGWDLWVSERQTGLARATSAQYVNPAVVGVADLDAAGRWDTIPEYGRVWSPTGVAADWAPYRDGQWIWQDPWGWTWVSTERWGWAPYHYGRWVTSSSRWFWVPVALPVRRVVYAPALVAFVGGGPVGTTVVVGGGYVGWFPLAPRDPFNPWWGPRAPVSVTQVTYVNRTYVTVVNQTTFVSGAVVANNYVRDRVVLHDIAAAPVVRGSLAVVPTRQSLWLAPRPGAVRAVAPPATVVSRSVVARVAPPPAPPPFQQKLTVIQQNRGAPIPPNVAAEMSIKDRGSAQAITAVRPVVAEAGRVTLAQARPAAGQPASAAPARVAVPVAPPRGRALATSDHPVAAAPVMAAPVTAARPQTLPVSADRQESGGLAARPTPVARPTAPARPTFVETDESRNRGRERPTPAPQVGSERPPQEQLRAPVGRATAARPPTTPVPNERVLSPERRPPPPTPARPPATPDVNERGRSHERTAERPTPVRPPSPEGNERRGSREAVPVPTSTSSGDRRATTRPPEPPRGGRGEPQQQEKRPTPTKTPGRPAN